MAGICQTSTGPSPRQYLLNKFGSVFDADQTGCTRLRVYLQLQEEGTLKYPKADPVPFLLHPDVETELERLKKGGSLEPSQLSK